METYQISVRETDCSTFTTYMLTCKLSEHRSPTLPGRQAVGLKWHHPVCLMCQTLYMHCCLAEHTVRLETSQNTSYFQGTFNHFYPIYAQPYTGNLTVFPPKYQNNLVSDQNTIILWHATVKIRFFLQSCHNTSTCTMTSTDEDVSEFKVLITARFINISKHLFTYLSSTWMGQSVGFSIPTWLPRQKITKINSRDTLHTVLLNSPET